MLVLQQFAPVIFSGGGSGVIVSIDSATISALGIDPADAYAGYRLGSDGLVYNASGNSLSWSQSVVDPEWVTPNSLAANYECRATLNSGSLTSGATGVWSPLTSDQSWYVAQTSYGVKEANITIEIRPVGGAVVASATIALRAEVSF